MTWMRQKLSIFHRKLEDEGYFQIIFLQKFENPILRSGFTKLAQIKKVLILRTGDHFYGFLIKFPIRFIQFLPITTKIRPQSANPSDLDADDWRRVLTFGNFETLGEDYQTLRSNDYAKITQLNILKQF